MAELHMFTWTDRKNPYAGKIVLQVYTESALIHRRCLTVVGLCILLNCLWNAICWTYHLWRNVLSCIAFQFTKCFETIIIIQSALLSKVRKSHDVWVQNLYSLISKVVCICKVSKGGTIYHRCKTWMLYYVLAYHNINLWNRLSRCY